MANNPRKALIFFSLTLNALLLVSTATAQSCEGKCGEKLDTCSCHSTCGSLATCCADLKHFCLDISPHSGSMLGGTDFTLLNTKFHQGDTVLCRFKPSTETEGYVDEVGVGHCISPLLYVTGWIPFEVLINGVTKAWGTWLSVHHSKLDAKFKITLVNATQWQYYGTPNMGGTLRMTWNSSLINAEKVSVELWGYNETGEQYNESWAAEWQYLYSVGKAVPNTGTFSFEPKPATDPHWRWEMGSMRVSPSSPTGGQRDVNALWSGAHALAWHLEQAFRADSAKWATAKCLAWDAMEERLPDFLSEIPDCPCTLAQARADTGRFHTDYGCDIEKGSKCTYHPGSVHCVRAIQASPKYGAGQQCCYDNTGAQVLTGDSIGGSTPDRGHDWGSPPYGNPPRIPGLSHWKYDVLSFYYCCLWSDNCQYYFKHRPSSDCRTYKPPKAGTVLGDPHFITFGGGAYTFNGRGEYYLLSSPDKGLFVQGRTEPVKLENGSLVQATRLSSVAMRENSSDVIEVRLATRANTLEVLRNQQVLSFSEQSWMDLQGVFVFSSMVENVTVMFPSGAGVEVRAREGAMATTVLLPLEFTNHTRGLLGSMTDELDDVLVSSDEERFDASQSTPEDLFHFGSTWAVSNETSLFTYDSAHLQDSYLSSPKHHDTGFIPAFSLPETPGDPLLSDMLKMCFGNGVGFCKYDTLATRSLRMGNATMSAVRSHTALVRDLTPVVSCGFLPAPTRGEKEGQVYLEGAELTFSCPSGHILLGSPKRTCQESGQWLGTTTHCVSDNLQGIILACVGVTAALVTLVAAITFYNRNLKRERQERLKATVIFKQM
ncbi:sushi domain-containing protein 2 [Alosa sapidissima]|uniref:sushi domain-containing protein 2 n=1 Tax=Alosa sapidissima TaxID=34773 RepID=UPI001C09E2BC|nr:sushi domain-containing protein 2 [Alosa sapidissima]